MDGKQACERMVVCFVSFFLAAFQSLLGWKHIVCRAADCRTKSNSCQGYFKYLGWPLLCTAKLISKHDVKQFLIKKESACNSVIWTLCVPFYRSKPWSWTPTCFVSVRVKSFSALVFWLTWRRNEIWRSLILSSTSSLCVVDTWHASECQISVWAVTHML